MNDRYNLNRFVAAQQSVYETVVQELQRGRKYGHWMWYIFPQVAGLGMSTTSQMYAIRNIGEAKAYYQHSHLGPRLRECTQLVMDLNGQTAQEIFGYIDNLKFRSCMTLFGYAATDDGLFREALMKYYNGKADEITANILESESN